MSETQVFKVEGPNGAEFKFSVDSFRILLHTVSSAGKCYSFAINNGARVVDGLLLTAGGDEIPFRAPELAAQVNAWLGRACTREKLVFDTFQEMGVAWRADEAGEGRAGRWWEGVDGDKYYFYMYYGVGDTA